MQDKKRRHYYTTAELSAIKTDYAEGMPRAEICEKYNITPGMIDGICTKYGARRKIKPKPKPQYPNRLYTLVSDDEMELPLTRYVNTVVELASITGIKLDTLYKAITLDRHVRFYPGGGQKVQFAKVLKLEV